MIKSQELKSGNIILGKYINEEDEKVNTTICTFLGYDPFNNYFWVENKDAIEDFCGFDPIPLSEEWLVRFGFDKDVKERRSIYKHKGVKQIHVIYKHKYYDLFLRLFDNGQISLCFNNEYILIKYVHRLQNIFNSLTGTDLQMLSFS